MGGASWRDGRGGRVCLGRGGGRGVSRENRVGCLGEGGAAEGEGLLCLGRVFQEEELVAASRAELETWRVQALEFQRRQVWQVSLPPGLGFEPNQSGSKHQKDTSQASAPGSDPHSDPASHPAWSPTVPGAQALCPCSPTRRRGSTQGPADPHPPHAVPHPCVPQRGGGAGPRVQRAKHSLPCAPRENAAEVARAPQPPPLRQDMADWVSRQGSPWARMGAPPSWGQPGLADPPPPCQLTLLNLSCCESRRVHGRPSPQAIWSVTCKGTSL